MTLISVSFNVQSLGAKPHATGIANCLLTSGAANIANVVRMLASE